EFQPSSFLSKPKVMIALFVVVGDTNEQAGTYAEAVDFWLLGKDNFTYLKAFPSVETARKHVYSEEDKAIMQANRIRMVVGNIKNVSAPITELVTQFKAAEVLIIPLSPGLDTRRKAIRLWATECIW